MAERPIFSADLGAYFRAFRERKGWNQRQTVDIAERRGLPDLTYNTLRYLEEGKTKNPDPDVLRAVAALYDVPYETLVAECIRAQYGLAMRPLEPGEATPETRPERELTAEEELLLGLYRTIPDKATQRDFLRMVSVAPAGLLAKSGAVARAVGDDEPVRPRPKRRRKAE